MDDYWNGTGYVHSENDSPCYLTKIATTRVFAKYLQNVPYAILGALIFPSVFFIHEDIWFGVVGAAIAFTFASFFSNVVVVVVIGSIFALSVVSFYF